MRRKWARYVIVLSLCMNLLVPAGHIQAKDVGVRVRLPDFEVHLNGHKVDNQYREYPLLVYKDVTYFPMTWYDSRLLGLEANWSPDNGLNIKQSPVTSSYEPFYTDGRNAASYMATVPSAAVTINGKAIDNTKEKYPLLNFRDVTYFPLTWKFAHDEFGWDYLWDDAEGLRITSHNPQVQTAGLPAYAVENDVALFKDYYYFVETTDTTNHVYRAPVQQPSSKEEIYSYNIETPNGLSKPLSFQFRDNTLWFTYHQGGGVTGYNVFVKIGDDGQAVPLHRGYLDFIDTPFGTLFVNFGAANDDGNLYLSQPGQADSTRKMVGDPELKFAQHVSSNVFPISTTSLVGDDVYVLCSPNPNESNYVFKINLKTNKTEKLANLSNLNWFQINNNKLYYVKDKDDALYSSALDGTSEVKLSDHAVSGFYYIDGNVFYITKGTSTRFRLYQAEANGKDRLVLPELVADVQVWNNRLVCQLGRDDEYGIVILDGSGRLQLTVANPVSRILKSDEGILFESALDSSVKIIR